LQATKGRDDKAQQEQGLEEREEENDNYEKEERRGEEGGRTGRKLVEGWWPSSGPRTQTPVA